MNHPIAVRALTMGLDFNALDDRRLLSRFKDLAARAETALAAFGWPLQTIRLVTSPLRPEHPWTPRELLRLVDRLAEAAAAVSAGCFCLPLAHDWPGQKPEGLEALLAALKRHPNLFLHQRIDDGRRLVDPAIGFAVEIMTRLAELNPSGAENFRFGAGAAIRPHTPFFPFSFHQGGAGFSLGLEYVGHFLGLAENLAGLPLEAQARAYQEALTSLAARVEALGRSLAAGSAGLLDYLGQDLSLAPFAGEGRSVGRLLARTMGGAYGRAGSIRATRLFSGVIKAAAETVKSVGFCGVMLAPLEDDGLALEIRRGHLDLNRLMLYSTVCGCGLDMIALPGRADPVELAALTADLGALALAHHKPLGARLLPIPGRAAGQMSDLGRPDLTDTVILPLP